MPLTYSFTSVTGVGFTAGFAMLKKGGKALVIFLIALPLLFAAAGIGTRISMVFDRFHITLNADRLRGPLTKVFGPSEKAYLIILACGGFFTDIVNSLLLTFFLYEYPFTAPYKSIPLSYW